MKAFFKFRDLRSAGRTHDVRLDRIVSVSELEALRGEWQFYATVDCGVEQAVFWCASIDMQQVSDWRAELMEALQLDAYGLPEVTGPDDEAPNNVIWLVPPDKS